MRRACQFVFAGLFALLTLPAARGQISFYTVEDSALRNNPQVRVGIADVQRAEAGVTEGVDAYKPSLLLGSGLGYTFGFPLGQPEIFSLTAQSLAFSFSQPDYIRAARAALHAAQLRLKDAREQTILNTALSYLELNKVNQEIIALNEEAGYVQKLMEVEDARVDAGRDSRVELTKARLIGAQVELKRLQLSDQADLLRARLGHLTGLPPADMIPDSQTIPAPRLAEPSGSIDSAVMDNNSGVQAAYAAAKSRLYTAFGDSRQNNRPTVSFVTSYGLFSNFNNYSEYYLHFQKNNLAAGIQITVPLFDGSRAARSRESSADAAHSGAEADLLRNQTSEDVLQLQKSLAELGAQAKVAELESELAQDQLAEVTTELASGSGNPNAPVLTPKDAQQAHIDERSRYIDMLDARFQLTQAQLNLMRSLGLIEDWAKSVPQAKR